MLKDGSIVKHARDGEQYATDHVKDPPSQHEAGPGTQNPANAPPDRRTLLDVFLQQFRQTRLADHATIMLGHAFAAEEFLALRATRNGFTMAVKPATLLGKGRHRALLFDDTCVADHIVQRALFRVPKHHEIADTQGERAED